LYRVERHNFNSHLNSRLNFHLNSYSCPIFYPLRFSLEESDPSILLDQTEDGTELVSTEVLHPSVEETPENPNLNPNPNPNALLQLLQGKSGSNCWLSVEKPINPKNNHKSDPKSNLKSDLKGDWVRVRFRVRFCLLDSDIIRMRA
jgi:hypothetical protein